MKYLWSWEWKMDNFDKEQELSAKFSKAMKENPKQFPKMLTNTCFTGRCKGFRVIEADSEEQLANLIALWWPTEKTFRRDECLCGCRISTRSRRRQSG